jgi:hypothetical protein
LPINSSLSHPSIRVAAGFTKARATLMRPLPWFGNMVAQQVWSAYQSFAENVVEADLAA